MAGHLRGLVTLAAIVLNVVFWFIPILIIAVFKLLLPVPAWQRWSASLLVRCAENWISVNGAILAMTTEVEWDIRGLERLRRDEWYLVISNHQAWIDVLVLQRVFNRRVPFFKFFIKRQLIWVPFLGLAWWALDMPFMRRHSRAYLEKHPEQRGKDLETARRACTKFRTMPTCVINFVEGTRSTPEKLRASGSHYRYLLRPRSGGIAFALGAMRGMLRQMIDVTIVYPDASFRFWDLCCGRMRRIVVDVRLREIPAWVIDGDYATDEAFKKRFHRWLGELWQQKDALIGDIRAETPE